MIVDRGTVFVDYLGYAATDDPVEFARLDAAARHRDALAGELAQIPQNAPWRLKWELAAACHDFVCDRCWAADVRLKLAGALASLQPFL